MAINGKLWVVLDDTAVIGATTSAKLEITQATEEVHTKSTADDFVRRMQTTKDWKIDFDGLFDPTETYQLEEIIDLILHATANTISVKFQPETPGTGDILLAGTGIFESVSLDAPNQAPMTISASVVGNSALVKSVQA
jgi:hypothetical protein